MTQTGFEITQARMLETALTGFRIRGALVVNEFSGPMLTLYDVKVPNGVKIKTVQNIAADIARQIRVKACNVTQSPETGLLRFEIARDVPANVPLSACFSALRAADLSMLPYTLGMDIMGIPIVRDLVRAPHLLIAGSTGSGKSVLLNAIIMSLIAHQNVRQCRLVMIDPKMLELAPYNGIPYLLTPVITSSERAVQALNMAVSEMEARYDELAEVGVRDIQEFNAIPGKAMPRIVIIIDEYADLMLTNRYELENCVLRLSQKARAAGIHLILTTQRPSVDIVTGVIKANFPTRVCMRVVSRIDSRVVLDQSGAENLLGRGDLLFMAPGLITPLRAHAPLIGTAEVNKVVNVLRGVK